MNEAKKIQSITLLSFAIHKEFAAKKGETCPKETLFTTKGSIWVSPSVWVGWTWLRCFRGWPLSITSIKRTNQLSLFLHNEAGNFSFVNMSKVQFVRQGPNPVGCVSFLSYKAKSKQRRKARCAYTWTLPHPRTFLCRYPQVLPSVANFPPLRCRIDHFSGVIMWPCWFNSSKDGKHNVLC